MKKDIIERINTIADKYRFRNEFEITEVQVVDFCRGLMQAQYIGLNLDEDDLSFIQGILFNL